MATYLTEPSRTFNEYLLIPRLTTKDCTPDKISLRTPLVKHKVGEEAEMYLNVPFTSAIMQAVSGEEMGVALAREGGLAFIYMSQSVESQAAMVRHVKESKSGFVRSKWNLKPHDTLRDILEIKEESDHLTIPVKIDTDKLLEELKEKLKGTEKITDYITIPVTEDGTARGKLLGIITSKDYRLSRDSLDKKVEDIMTPVEKLVYAKVGLTLSEANDIIWEKKINCLPVIEENGNLNSLVFRKDYEQHKENPLALQDKNQSYLVGAGVNTRDYEERIPALVEAGVDILCLDSSDGFSVWQKEVIEWVHEKYNGKIKIGAGNVVSQEAFYYLADAGADFIKIGIGGGSICITRETKGIGRGQATSIIDVAAAREEYAKRTGIYIPLCADGGIVHDHHITLALAMGCDFVMMGRYFARFDESPTRVVKINNNYVKEYWGEGSNRARNWQRYDMGGAKKLSFEEGVDSYIPYAGSLKDNLDITVAKIKSTMCNCGAITIPELHEKARLTLVSNVSIQEGSAHDVILKEIDKQYK